MTDALLRARNVARRFGSQVALEPTDIDVRAGETLALIGPNGAGKSTLLSILAGALEPSAGRLERLDGVRVGWVPQRSSFYDRLTARENLELFARLEGEGDPAETAERLLAEERVAVAPGEGFGPSGAGWVRLSLAVSDETIEAGAERLHRAFAAVTA